MRLRNKNGIRTRRAIEKAEGDAFQKTQLYFYKLFSEEPSPSITEAFIKELHHHWLGQIYEMAGSYRQKTISKGDIPFPPVSLPNGTPNIPKLMREFESEILRKYTPCPKSADLMEIVRAIAVVHGEFEMIHPFREANGRVGRLIADLMALQAGYPPLIFSRTRKSYFEAMKKVFIEKNYAPLEKIIEKAMKRGIEKARKDM